VHDSFRPLLAAVMPPKKSSRKGRAGKAPPETREKDTVENRPKEELPQSQSSFRARGKGNDDALEQAVLAYVKTMGARINDLLIVKDEKVFELPDYDAFAKEMMGDPRDFGAIVNNSDSMGRICDSMGQHVGVYLKDVNSAKMLLSVIFGNFSVDKDVRLGHEELKESVQEELCRLDESIRQNIDLWEQYHNYRGDKSVEAKINFGCEDLMLSLWVLEGQLICHSMSTLLQMTAGYYALMETIRETYDLLQMPGTIGHRRTHLRVLRNHLYG